MADTALKFSRPDLPSPPDHLQSSGRALWSSTLADWNLQSSELVTLALACECKDRLAEIREQIAAEGILITDPSERKRSNPLLAAEAQIMGVQLRAWKMLDLVERVKPKVGRPSTR